MDVFRPFHLENVRSPQFSIAEEKNEEKHKIATRTGQFPVIKNLLYQERKPSMLIHCMCESEEYEHIIVDNEREENSKKATVKFHIFLKIRARNQLGILIVSKNVNNASKSEQKCLEMRFRCTAQ